MHRDALNLDVLETSCVCIYIYTLINYFDISIVSVKKWKQFFFPVSIKSLIIACLNSFFLQHYNRWQILDGGYEVIMAVIVLSVLRWRISVIEHLWWQKSTFLIQCLISYTFIPKSHYTNRLFFLCVHSNLSWVQRHSILQLRICSSEIGYLDQSNWQKSRRIVQFKSSLIIPIKFLINFTQNIKLQLPVEIYKFTKM